MADDATAPSGTRLIVQPVRIGILAGWLAIVSALAALPGCSGKSPIGARDPVPAALQTALGSSPDYDHFATFYRKRSYRPLWVQEDAPKPEAHALIRMLAKADRDGLDPERYEVSHLAAMLSEAGRGAPAALVRAELSLSRAFTEYILDLRQPIDGAGMIFTDPSVAPPQLSAQAVIEAAGRAGSLRRHLTAAQRMHPLYEALRQRLADYRSRWSALPQITVPWGSALKPGMSNERVRLLRRRLGLAADGAEADRFDDSLAGVVRRFQDDHGLRSTGVVDARTIRALNKGPRAYEQLMLANLERLRALPVNPGRRHILVDAAAAKLWLYEDRQVRDSMRVIVGKPSEQTPAMAGLIRFAIFNPYWNLPPDLARNRVNEHVLVEGMDYLRREKLEVLSDWSDQARVLDPQEVDWEGAAAGRQKLRMRQLPGPHNVMGAVKFMMPNRLGIYLHDTPDKSPFGRTRRTLSSGCVRVEDADRLSRWLFQGRAIKVKAQQFDQRVDLPVPVPVYITYLTAAPMDDGIAFRPDIYRRDPALIARLDRAAPQLADSTQPLASRQAGGM